MPGKCMFIVMPKSHQGHNTLCRANSCWHSIGEPQTAPVPQRKVCHNHWNKLFDLLHSIHFLFFELLGSIFFSSLFTYCLKTFSVPLCLYRSVCVSLHHSWPGRSAGVKVTVLRSSTGDQPELSQEGLRNNQARAWLWSTQDGTVRDRNLGEGREAWSRCSFSWDPQCSRDKYS